MSIDTSARHLKKAIEAGQCQMNGRVERFATRQIGAGDIIHLDIDQEQKVIDELPYGSHERILYIDEEILAYNKPSGISSEQESLLTYLKEYPHLTLLHRLDRNTTGVLLFARNEATAKAMLKLFKERKITKTYYAIVDGAVKKPNGIVENFLGKILSYHGQTIWGAVSNDKGLYAKTDWYREKTGKEASLIRCLPETGRTHQIRIHLSDLGHPILGDHQYGRSFQCPYHPTRQMLHASEVSFIHPVNGQPIVIKAPLPNDFIAAMNVLF